MNSRKRIVHVVMSLMLLATTAVAIATAKVPSSVLIGEEGSLLWMDLFGEPQKNEVPASDAITAADGAVYVAGFNDTDWSLRAYNANDGSLLWSDVFDIGFFEVPTGVTVSGGKVFATGSILPTPLIRAHDSRSGQLLWEQDLFTTFGTFDSSVVHGNTVVAVGGNRTWLVDAFDTENGTPKWKDRFGVGSQNRATGVAEQGGRIFVGGRARPPNSSLNWFVRAYNASSGDILWENYSPSGFFSQVQSIAVSGNSVIAVGRVSAGISGPYYVNTDWRIRAYDAGTGALLWEEIVDKGGDDFPTGAVDVAVRGSQAFVVGSGGFECRLPVTPSQNCDLIVRAYDIRSGQLLWEDQLDRSPFDEATSVTVNNAGVFVIGHGGNDCDSTDQTNCDIFFRAYRRRTGELFWEDRIDTQGTAEFGVGIASLDGKIFGSGVVNDAYFFADLLVRAYEFGDQQ